MTTLRTLGKNVLITPISDEKMSFGGLHLPGGQKNGPARGIIESVAKGIDGLRESDTILYERNAPTVDAGEGRLIINADHIVAVLA